MTEYRIMVAGSERWGDEELISSAIFAELVAAGRRRPLPDRVVLVTRGSPGADTLAGRVAARWQIPVEVHVADEEMVATGADVLLAFPLTGTRGGLRCMALAKRAGIPVRFPVTTAT